MKICTCISRHMSDNAIKIKMLNSMDSIKKYVTVLLGPIVAVICGIILLIKKSRKNMMSPHITQCQNKTCNSTDSENLNSYSSNEDLSIKYLEKIKDQSNKDITLRQKKKRKRNHNPTSVKKTNTQRSMCVSEMKENIKPSAAKCTATNRILGLREKCNKVAALKPTINSSKSLRACHTDEISKSDLAESSSSLSSSSTASLSSSSASSSPAQSVNCSPTASPTASKRLLQLGTKKSATAPLRQFTKLNMSERELAQEMERYIIPPNLLRIYGFPVESIHYEGCVEIYKCLPKHLAEEAITQDNQRHHCHIYGRKKYNFINNIDQRRPADSLADSGLESSESSPRFTDSDSSDTAEDDTYSPIMAFYTPDGVYQIFSEYCVSREKQCVRCSKAFHVTENGEYMSFDSCTYHWGKLSNVYDGKRYVNVYTCCQNEELSEGCSKHPLHVWNGVVVGINGPYTGFLHTQYKHANDCKHSKIYALDCEMSYTGLGLEVTKITVVGFNGAVVYEHFVQPQAKIIDYNTRFSGVSENDFSPNSNTSIKTFAEVQKDLLNLFDSDTILIGHGLENDLKVLRIVHKRIVDTSLIFSHSTGYPYRRSLKMLTKSFLKRDIQCGDLGHNSFEDSQACLELMLWQIRKDLRHWNYG